SGSCSFFSLASLTNFCLYVVRFSTTYCAPSAVVASLALVLEVAQSVVQKLTASGQKLISDAKAKKEQEPLTTWMLARRASTNFAGTDLGTEAATLLNDLKKDARFQADLKAWQTLQKVRNLQGQLRSPPGVTEATDPSFRRLNVRTLQQ